MRKTLRRSDDAVLWEGEAATVKGAILAAIAVKADLSEADLSEADLSGADLSGANLSGANLSRANLSGANLSGADLSEADLSGANLPGADLPWADLSRANLSGANLSGADLSEADLSGADLSRANLSEATGVSAERCTPLLMLRDQPGTIHAYKLVTADGVGPFNGGITYEVGGTYEVLAANADALTACGAGINVATLDWCLREWAPGYRILIAAFEAKDIAAIPTATDGKFRLYRCRIVGEKDLAGLVPEQKAVTS